MKKTKYMKDYILTQLELFYQAGINPFYLQSNNREDSLDVPQLKLMRKVFEDIKNQKQERGYA